MKTLIVEDDKTLADILAFTFVREGFEVVQAFTGSDALSIWEKENPESDAPGRKYSTSGWFQCM